MELIVHAKLLGAVASKLIFGADPLQISALFEVVTAGFGFTVTLIVNGKPTHDPVTDLGVTM